MIAENYPRKIIAQETGLSLKTLQRLANPEKVKAERFDRRLRYLSTRSVSSDHLSKNQRAANYHLKKAAIALEVDVDFLLQQIELVVRLYRDGYADLELPEWFLEAQRAFAVRNQLAPF